MSKKLPAFKTDDEAAAFLDREDLSDFIGADRLVPARFEFAPKEKTVTLRLSEGLLSETRAAAARAGMPYQRFIRQAIEAALVKKA